MGLANMLCAQCAAWCLAACGRIGFDSLGGAHGVGDARGDGVGTDGTGDAPQMLSCSGLASVCGPAGTSSCCGSPIVSAGTFDRSHDVAADNMFPDVTNPATVSDFRLDTYEVTVGRFRAFVDAGLGTQASPPSAGAGGRTLNSMSGQGGWDPTWNPSLTADTSALVAAVTSCGPAGSWTSTQGANEALPMNCISWFEAFAFCAWDGGFLPTEAEWNYAAAAGAEQRAYPWSNPPGDLTIDCSFADHFGPGSMACVNPPGGAVDRVGSQSPKGDGKFGQADLAGNVMEWTLDWSGSYPNPCSDCADLTVGSNRTIRGGAFFFPAPDLRSAIRTGDPPDSRSFNSGVRCARP